MKSHYIWMNGTIVETSAASVPLLTAGFHYGIGIFEGIRAYHTPRGPAVFRLHEHMRRFEASAHILGWASLPYSFDTLVAATLETVKKSAFPECYIRPFAYLAEGGWNLTLDTGKVHVAIAVWEQSVYLGEEARDRGMSACVSSFVRHHPNAMMTKAKISGNYVNSYLAKTEAQRGGFDEAILLDPTGYVSECSGANLFVVQRGRLVTPTPDTILEGITRATVFDLAKDLGLDVQEARLSRDHLYVADEVFVCGTAAEVRGISTIDRRTIGTGRPGPITTKIAAAYQDAVHGQYPRSKDWLAFCG
jgi:branched-chain amino acid aminotransferase